MTERPILFSAPMVKAILAGQKTQTRRAVTSLRVRVRGAVRPDFSDIIETAPRYVARPGKSLPARMNDRGAVTVLAENGEWLGLKPGEFDFVCPYVNGRTYLQDTWRIDVDAGSSLYVRETWGCPDADHPLCKDGRKPTEGDKIVYLANDADAWQWDRGGVSIGSFVWRPSIHMPRWASRIDLAAIGARIERLQSITTEDIIAEGVEVPDVDYSVGERPDFLDAERACFARSEFRGLWDSINSERPGCSWGDNPWVWAVVFKQINGAQPQRSE